MPVVRGIIREVGQSRTVQVSARRWYGTTDIVVQDPESNKIYSVRVTAKTLDKCQFLPRVGMSVIIHGYVEEADFGLSDYVVSRVTSIKHEGAGLKRVHRFDEE